jgi:hypothetical protein
MSLQLLPPPMVIDGGLALPSEIAGGVVDGALGECVVCRRTCWSWWSATPPNGFVALHRDRCPARLRELWSEAMKDGDVPETQAPVISRGRGAYGRRAASAAARAPERTTFALRKGIELPEDFTPGPFWKPGYSHLTPWVVAFESGAGGGHSPFGDNADAARRHLGLIRARGVVGYNVPVVGAVLVAPDGTRVCEWGEAPVVGVARWEGITQLPEWRRCAGCGGVRWPGSWLTVRTGRCRACQEPLETADPRPWPQDPDDPGLATAPDWLGGPKKAKKRAVGIG